MIQTLKKVSLTAVTFLCAIPLAHAVPIGQVTPGVSNSPAVNANYVNSIIARNNGTNPSAYDIAGQTYTLLNPTGTLLPFADFNVRAQGGVGGDNTIDLNGGNAGFCFAIVKYDGNNGSSLVFDIRGLSSLMVPATITSDRGRDITPNSYRLFGCLPNPSSVPDGGTTLMLLGLSVGGVELLRRAFLKRSATI